MLLLVAFPKNILVLFSHWTLRLRPDSHAERSAEGGESKSRCTGCRKAAHCQGVAQCDAGLQIQYLFLETALAFRQEEFKSEKPHNTPLNPLSTLRGLDTEATSLRASPLYAQACGDSEMGWGCVKMDRCNHEPKSFPHFSKL